MLRILLLIGLLLVGTPSQAEDTNPHDPYKALVEILKQTDRNINAQACTVDATVDFALYQPKLAIFRDAWLNRDYSVDFYAQRGKQVLAFVVLKHEAELLTEGLYNGHETPECKFSLSVAYPDKFGQVKSIKVVTWKFNNQQSHKINWEKFDPKDFNEIALDYHLNQDVETWIADEPQMEPNKQPTQTDDCDMYMFKANAIFIRATTFCRKDYMDSKAGYAALAGARKCAASIGDDIKPQVAATMQLLDRMVRQRGRAAACAMVEDIARNVNAKTR